MASNSNKSISSFTPNDFYVWRVSMMSHFAAKGFLGVIDNVSDGWVAKDEATKVSLQRKCYNTLIRALGRKNQYLAQDLRTEQAKELWDRLIAQYGQTNMAAKMSIAHQM